MPPKPPRPLQQPLPIATVATAYWHAAQRALHGCARGADAFAEALDALWTMSHDTSRPALAQAAGRALDLGRARLRAESGHPGYAAASAADVPPDIRPGRGVWVVRNLGGRLVTVPATVLEVDAITGRALLAPEADEKALFWALACLLEPRLASVSTMPTRTASPTVA